MWKEEFIVPFCQHLHLQKLLHRYFSQVFSGYYKRLVSRTTEMATSQFKFLKTNFSEFFMIKTNIQVKIAYAYETLISFDIDSESVRYYNICIQ